jgi:hypothetical protein
VFFTLMFFASQGRFIALPVYLIELLPYCPGTDLYPLRSKNL